MVATGGGIVLRPENWGYLRQGVIAWINVPVEELQRRLQGDQERPLLQRQDWPHHLAELLARRRQLYEAADIHLNVATGDTVEALCDRLMTLLEERILPPPATTMSPEG